LPTKDVTTHWPAITKYMCDTQTYTHERTHTYTQAVTTIKAAKQRNTIYTNEYTDYSLTICIVLIMHNTRSLKRNE